MKLTESRNRLKGRESMPSKAEIFEYWKDWLIKEGFDLGEPCCWACGRWWDTRYDVQDPEASWDEIRRAWNRVPLQRCHIIPRSLGGSNDPSNLFLMCRECHDRAPNTTSREAFLTWVKGQSWIKRRMAEIKEEMETFNIKEEDLEEMLQIVQSPGFIKWALKHIGIHLSQQSGPKITMSTIIAAILEYKNLLERYRFFSKNLDKA